MRSTESKLTQTCKISSMADAQDIIHIAIQEVVFIQTFEINILKLLGHFHLLDTLSQGRVKTQTTFYQVQFFNFIEQWKIEFVVLYIFLKWYDVIFKFEHIWSSEKFVRDAALGPNVRFARAVSLQELFRRYLRQRSYQFTFGVHNVIQ